MEAPDFWNDPEVSQNKMKEVKSLKDDVATYAALSTQYDDIEKQINDPEKIDPDVYLSGDRVLYFRIPAVLDDFRSHEYIHGRIPWSPASGYALYGEL